MTFELGSVKSFVYGKLSTDSVVTGLVGARIFDEYQADGGIGWPSIILQVVSAPDILGVGATRVLTTALVRVKAITKGAGMQSGMNIASAIDTALHKVNGTADGHYVTCHRVGSFSYSEVVAGEMFRHVGGEFRIQVHPTT